jgi:adenosylcobinamide-phosphate synthase
MVMEMAPILLAALVLDALFGLWRPGWLAEIRPDLVQRRVRTALRDDLFPAFDRRTLGLFVLLLGFSLALTLGWLVQSLPLSGLFGVALATAGLGMKRLSHQAHAVADALRSAPDTAAAAYQRFSGDDHPAPKAPDIAPQVYAALPDRMARDVLTPALALLIFGLPGLLASGVIRLLRDPETTAGWAATRLDILICWPANWITCALLGRLDPELQDGDTPAHIDARMEALWKLWLILLATAATLTLL